MSFLFVGDAAKLLGVRPKEITDLFYRGLLNDSICPIVGNRRCIPPDYVDQIGTILRRRQG